MPSVLVRASTGTCTVAIAFYGSQVKKPAQVQGEEISLLMGGIAWVYRESLHLWRLHSVILFLSFFSFSLMSFRKLPFLKSPYCPVEFSQSGYIHFLMISFRLNIFGENTM